MKVCYEIKLNFNVKGYLSNLLQLLSLGGGLPVPLHNSLEN